MLTPLTPLKYAVATGLLLSLTISGFTGTVKAFSDDSQGKPQTVQIDDSKPEKIEEGTIKVKSVKKIATPTPKPTPTPTQRPKPKITKKAESGNKLENRSSNTSRQQQPVVSQPQRQAVSTPVPQKPKAIQQPVQQPVQKPAAPVQNNTPADTTDDDDAAWEAQRNANPNNQQKDGNLNYDSSQTFNGVTVHGGY